MFETGIGFAAGELHDLVPSSSGHGLLVSPAEG